MITSMMEFSVSSILLAILGVYFLSKTASFIKNYLAAVRTGYPIWVSPVFSHSIAWMVFAPMFRPQMERYLPAWLYDRVVGFCAGWEFHAGTHIHKKLGKTFVMVTPDECSLWSVSFSLHWLQ